MAVKNARDNGDSEFEVSGKKYKLKEILTLIGLVLLPTHPLMLLQ